MKHVILYSGGHSSALVAVEVSRKYGAENCILLNHDITPIVEDDDIKRFKWIVSIYLGIPVTYANHERWETATPVDVCLDAKAWKVGAGQILCTNRLKTAPFNEWLKHNDPDKQNIYYYGFDVNEVHRIQRRSGIMGEMGYKTDYPLALWKERTIHNIEELHINRPLAYSTFKHANCAGCLKAGWQHWYVVYCTRPDLWERTKNAEDEIGYALHKDKDGPVYLEDRQELFSRMRGLGVNPTEHIPAARFWADVKKLIKESELDDISDNDQKPCECSS